ncbi:hypothetical protein DFJ74DRAFT_714423 [Hyaloraphidium curvatum]|nr:hypothetical protein DFJ74DRAFT_714423 [Hyaloraphidium curvatum]
MAHETGVQGAQGGASADLGVPGVSGHVYTTSSSLPFSVEKEWYLCYADSCTVDDLFVGMIDKVGQCVTPLTTMLGLKPTPMMVTRDFRLQLHPSMVAQGSKTMIPGAGDHLWFRMYMLDVSKAYIKCEFEFRLVGDLDWAKWAERDIAGGRASWGSGVDRRPGIPVAAGVVGYVSILFVVNVCQLLISSQMVVVRDPKTHRLRAAPPDLLPVAEWTRRGIFHSSILAGDMLDGEQAYKWLLHSTEADGFAAEEVVPGDRWEALPEYEWRSRRTDNDSLGHTTVHRRVLPFFDACYALLPKQRVAGMWFECKTEILPDQDCTIRGVHIPGADGRARFLLDNGGGPGRLNRCGVWLVDRARVRLKSAGGGPA